MNHYTKILDELSKNQNKWLITGVAGFIGSHLLENLLTLNQQVVGIDNFLTGSKNNLEDVKDSVSSSNWKNFTFYNADITSVDVCMEVTKDIDFVLHQAALGSIPRSIERPIDTNNVNVNGFMNIIFSSKERNVKSFTYASSSSVYGDHATLPKVEKNIGTILSPYGVSKYTNELYASVFSRCYDFKSIGLRYFNVFGKRQNPQGAYAAVIPKWISFLKENKDIFIYGDGKTSRDFCFIDNVIQANILSAYAESDAKDAVYNVAVGEQTSLNELYEILNAIISKEENDLRTKLLYKDFRAGDIRHSIADISSIKKALGYEPQVKIREGLEILLRQNNV